MGIIQKTVYVNKETEFIFVMLHYCIQLFRTEKVSCFCFNVCTFAKSIYHPNITAYINDM